MTKQATVAALRHEREAQQWPTHHVCHHTRDESFSHVCRHTPHQTYTRHECVCGRPIWPIKGRGRGESILSHRRVAARMRALEAATLYASGMSFRQTAAQLGYKTGSGAWRAVTRLGERNAAWNAYTERQE